MPDDPKTPEGSGDQASQNGPGKQGAPADDPKAGGAGDGGDPPAPKDPEYVTPTALQGVLDAHKRTSAAEVKAVHEEVAGLKTTIEALTKALAGKPKDDGSKAPAGDSAGDDGLKSEVVDLRQQVENLTTQLREEADGRAEAEKKGQEFKFRTDVMAALTAAGCEEPEAAFLVIQPKLQTKDDGTIFGTVTTAYGPQDKLLKDYIESHFREEVLPHVFRGRTRPGAPANGDGGGSGVGAGGSFDMTREQAFDAKAYLADPDKHRAALERGRVKDVPKPGQFSPEHAAGGRR